MFRSNSAIIRLEYSVRGKITCLIKMQVCRGGDEISFANMGLVAEVVLAQVCVRLVSSFVGRLARGVGS